MSKTDNTLDSGEVRLSASYDETRHSGRVDLVAPDTPTQIRRTRQQEEEAECEIKRIQSHKDSIRSYGEDDRCLICMNGFTKRQPMYKIPCSANCNDTSVHEKCIYEWKERQQSPGSCPLCRSPLKEMTYVPPDVLRSASFHIFSVRKDFVTRPLDPKVGMVRCYVRVMRTGVTGVSLEYEIYLQAPSILRYPLGPLPRSSSPANGDQLLLVARKKYNGLAKGQIDLTLDRFGKDYDREGVNYIGSLYSNFTGLDHVGMVPSNGTSSKSGEVMCIQYSQNRIGRGVGPRRMRVAFPKAEVDPNATSPFEDEDDDEEEDFDRQQGARYKMGINHSQTKTDSLSSALKDHTDHAHRLAQSTSASDDLGTYVPPEKVIFGKNKEPYWLESIMAYSLDFHGRVTLPSNKNFIMMIPLGHRVEGTTAIPGDTSEANVCLQFGKVEEIGRECYTLDIAYPLSVLQGAFVALSACDRKLACA